MKIAKRCVCCDGARLSRTPAVLAPFLAYRIFGYEPAEITADWGLRDIKSGHAYTMCNSLECADCGMLFLDMRFDDEEMEGLYRGYRDAEYTATRDRFEPGYAERNRQLEAGCPYLATVEAFIAPYVAERPRILDFGGDTGSNTPFRGRAASHDIHDISGLAPIAGARIVSLDQARRENYDLVISRHVLEHVSSPIAVVQAMASLMRRDSLLYIEVPLEEIMRDAGKRGNVAASKRLWHEHINFYRESSLEALLWAAGLSPIAARSQAVDASGKPAFIQSMLARKVDAAGIRDAAE